MSALRWRNYNARCVLLEFPRAFSMSQAVASLLWNLHQRAPVWSWTPFLILHWCACCVHSCTSSDLLATRCSPCWKTSIRAPEPHRRWCTSGGWALAVSWLLFFFDQHVISCCRCIQCVSSHVHKLFESHMRSRVFISPLCVPWSPNFIFFFCALCVWYRRSLELHNSTLKQLEESLHSLLSPDSS